MLILLQAVMLLLVICRVLVHTVVHRSPIEPHCRSQASCPTLLLGGGLSPKLTAGDLREFQLVDGNFDRLYDDDSLLVHQLETTPV